MNIALIGDFNEEVAAHRAIPRAIELTGKQNVHCQWLHSNDIELEKLAMFSAIWCVPGSPYANMENVLNAIQYARFNDIPFLGTCGGYQHVALEYARNVLGFTEADNTEVNPAYLSIFEGSELTFSGFDKSGDPRILEISKNRFFVGTAFQPERSAFAGQVHPLISRFVESALHIF